MADENDPTKIFGSLGGETKDIVSGFFRMFQGFLKDSGNDVKELTTAVESLGDKAKKNSQSLTVMGAGANFSSLKDPIDKLLGSMMKLSQFADTSKMFEKIGKDASQNIGSMSASVALSMTAVDKVFAGTAAMMNDKLDDGRPNKFKQSFVAMYKEMEAGIGNFINNAQAGQQLESSFVGLSATGGDLNKIFAGQGGELKDLQALTTNYVNQTAKAADITKYSIDQTTGMANALKQIPGVMDQMITSGDKGSESTTSLIGVMNMMSGTGQNQETVINNLTKAYEDFASSGDGVNSSAQKGAEFLATISSVSTSLNLRFQDVQNTMAAVADQFRFVGNETDATAKTIGRYTEALKESGVSGKAALDITKGLIDGIQGMSVGTKAFLSLRSGGPGGLQGAFQIDKMLREGKLDQVALMAEQSLRKQFGGRIVTQNESAQSPQLASQYMRQQQLMQSGVFGIGKGMDQAQIGKLIDAMAKGDMKGAAAQIKTGQDAVTAVTKQGQQLQERANNSLKDISRSVEKGALFGQITAGAAIRNAMGAGVAGQADRNMRERVAGNNMATTLREQGRGIGMGAGGPNPDEVSRQLILLTRGAENATSAVGGVLKGVGKSVMGVAGSTVDAVSAMKQMVGENLTTPMSPQIQMPEHLRAQRTAPETNTVVGKSAPMTIRLEITHPDGMTVKKTDTSIQKYNKASTVIDFTNQ